MALAVVHGQRLDAHLLGTKPCPPKYLPILGNALAFNPDYENWVTTDQGLLGWLFGSMEPVIACDVLRNETSSQVWDALKEWFGYANRSKVNQLRMSLQSTRKNSMKMNEYLASMKHIAHNVALAGEPILDGYLISSVIAWLDYEYLPINCQINASGNMSWQEAHTTLMTF
ncbi:hypothetical protein UlMin_017604 [Ulmus minor]